MAVHWRNPGGGTGSAQILHPRRSSRFLGSVGI